jgi:anti-anti-sigma factor
VTLVDITPHDAGPPAPMPSGPRLTLRTAYRHGVYVVAPYGELDLATVPDLQRAMDRAEASDAREIVLDLSNLSFLDSTGLRLVIHADARSRSDGNRLRLLRGTPSVHRLFDLCGLADRLPFVG